MNWLQTMLAVSRALQASGFYDQLRSGPSDTGSSFGAGRGMATPTSMMPLPRGLPRSIPPWVMQLPYRPRGGVPLSPMLLPDPPLGNGSDDAWGQFTPPATIQPAPEVDYPPSDGGDSRQFVRTLPWRGITAPDFPLYWGDAAAGGNGRDPTQLVQLFSSE